MALRVQRALILIWLSLLAGAAPRARADAAASSAPALHESAPTSWMQLGLGASLTLPRGERRDGGLDLGAAYGFRQGRFRVGAELRYTYLGGFDVATQIYRASEATYRVDLGPAFAVELFSSGRVSLQLGARALFSRSGTYRRSGALLGSWECDAGGCSSDGVPSRAVPFVAFYGFSAALDMVAVFPSFFLRVSALRTRWFRGHEVEPPKVQHWLQFALGFAY
jgi:hypothetical protein